MQVTEQTEEGVIALCVKKVAGHYMADDTEWVGKAVAPGSMGTLYNC